MSHAPTHLRALCAHILVLISLMVCSVTASAESYRIDGFREVVITTEKDAVRLQKLDFPKGRILALQIEPRPENIDDYKSFILKEVESLLDS